MKQYLWSLLFLPQLLCGDLLFQKKEGPITLEIRGLNQLTLDQKLNLEIQLHHPQGHVPSLENFHPMKPNEFGIYPFYLKGKTIESVPWGTNFNFILEPQLSGAQDLDLGTLKVGAVELTIPKISIEIEPLNVKRYPLDIAPLLPLIKGDPLELNLEMRRKLYNQDQSKRNVAIFQSYTFPWLPLFPLLVLLVTAPFFLHYWLIKIRRERKKELPSFYTLMEQIKALQQSSLPPKELVFEVAKLFKMGFDNGPSMTYQELLQKLTLSEKYTLEQRQAFQTQFTTLEQLQYRKESPTKSSVILAMEQAEQLLQIR